MSFTTDKGAALFTPERIDSLLTNPVLTQSVAARVSTIIRTRSKSVSIPQMDTGVTATWVDELQEIPISTPTFKSFTVIPRKVGNLVPVSAESIDDADPDIVALIGTQLVDAMVKGVDAAFLSSVTDEAEAPFAPSGLTSITPTEVQVGADGFTHFTPFVEVASMAEHRNVPITAWIMSPATRAQILTRESLVATAPFVDPPAASRARTVRTIEGGQIIPSDHVPDDVIWAIPASRVLMVVRRDVTLARSDHSLFGRDGVSLRSIMRVGFGFPEPSAIVKMTAA